MGFEQNKTIVMRFFEVRDWSEHQSLAYEIFHPEYPADEYSLSGLESDLKNLERGPTGFLKRNTQKLPSHEVINIYGDDTTVIAEYLLTVDPKDNIFFSLPDKYEPFKLLGYHTFMFKDGKIIGLRTVWDVARLTSKFPNVVGKSHVDRYMRRLKEGGYV